MLSSKGGLMDPNNYSMLKKASSGFGSAMRHGVARTRFLS
jgi:hypothetical protein